MTSRAKWHDNATKHIPPCASRHCIAGLQPGNMNNSSKWFSVLSGLSSSLGSLSLSSYRGGRHIETRTPCTSAPTQTHNSSGCASTDNKDGWHDKRRHCLNILSRRNNTEHDTCGKKQGDGVASNYSRNQKRKRRKSNTCKHHHGKTFGHLNSAHVRKSQSK